MKGGTRRSLCALVAMLRLGGGLLPRLAARAATASAPSPSPSLLLRRSKWSSATYKPKPPPPPPPAPQAKMVVLFPRQTSHKTSLEVKKRVLRSVPHMGGKRLKRMVRLHARKGNRNSFIADFESRLDRFLYRTNAVNSTFAARMLIGHKHVMVNGKMVNSTHYILKPGDIVEPNKAPQTLAVWKRMMARRLANNTFVIASRNGEDDRDGGRRCVPSCQDRLLVAAMRS